MRATSHSVSNWILRALLGLVPLGCRLPFGGPSSSSGPPSLRVEFDAATASARLVWTRPAQRGLRRYEVERREGGSDEIVARIDAGGDTTYTDDGILGNRPYRYRVICVFAAGHDDRQEQRLESTTVEGGIHRFVDAWDLPSGFRPTRIAIDRAGVLHVVGAGGGWVERCDGAGHALGRWPYTAATVLCLETATLDGPAAACDDDGNLYVVHNDRGEGGLPQPRLSKLGADGQVRWTRPLQTLFARHIAIDDGRIFVESISQLQQLDAAGEVVAHRPVPPLKVSSIHFVRGAFAALVEPFGYDTAGWQAARLVFYSTFERAAVSAVLGRDPTAPEDRGAGLLLRPTDFAADAATNRVFVVNAGHGRIEVFRDGLYLTRWGGAEGDASAFAFRGTTRVLADVTTGELAEKEVVAGGIARDGDGYIYVADTFNDRIAKLAP